MKKQEGAILIVSIVMLSVLLLMILVIVKSSITEFKIVDNKATNKQTFADAESALNKFVTANATRFAPGFLSQTGASGPSSSVPLNTGINVGSGTSTVNAVEVHCGPMNDFGTMMGALSLDAVSFDISADSTKNDSLATVHRGIQTPAASGACNY